MSFSMALSQAVTCPKPGISKLSLRQSLCTHIKCQAELHESLDRQDNRKRRRVSLCEQSERKRRYATPSGQSDRKRHDLEISARKRAISTSATINSLEDQVSCLKKLLQQAYAPLRKTSTKHKCPSLSCEKSFTTLEHLYRHIRAQKDLTHEALTGLINETHCSVCSKTCRRPNDLVKHERAVHCETYVSRLDKFLGTSVPLSPLSSDPMAINGSSSR